MRYYTADPHFHHPRIIELCNRPYADVDEMNEAILQNYCSTGTDADELWILGDFIMGIRAETIPPIMERLRPHWRSIHLVPGNHDHCHPSNKKHIELRETRYRANGIIVEPTIVYTAVGGTFVTLSHFPPHGDTSQYEERFNDWRPTLDDDEWLLHGHIHTEWKQRGQWINVGVDVRDFRPVSELEVKEIIERNRNGN